MSEAADAAFLDAAEFIDADHPAIVAYARDRAAGADGDLARAIALYGAVRDGIKYDIYRDYSDPATFRASSVLTAGRGFCVGKAAVLAACCRAVGIPARVGYADVRNHMTSPRLHALTQTDVFYWHSYADIRLNGTWVKATPAFDRELCARMGIPPLEFDGRSDSLFQSLDAEGTAAHGVFERSRDIRGCAVRRDPGEFSASLSHADRRGEACRQFPRGGEGGAHKRRSVADPMTS